MLSTTGMTGLGPFCGSGSTLIATEKVWRQVRLVELDRRLVDVMVRRCRMQSRTLCSARPLSRF
jgi:DNA modification methylase